MIPPSLVAAKLTELSERLAMVKKHRLPTASHYALAPEARDLVAFNLMLAVQSAADLAAHAIADQTWPAVRTVAEAFERLAQRQVITPELAIKLQRAVGFRNVIAHGYGRLNLDVLCEAATHGPGHLEEFASSFARWTQTPES